MAGDRPSWVEALRSTCQDLNPGWEFRLWGLQDAVAENFTHLGKMKITPTMSMQSDMMRFEILYRYGGLYVDIDFICLRPFSQLLTTFPEAALLVANEADSKEYMSGGFIATVPKHPAIQRAYEEIPNIDVNGNPSQASGPFYWGKFIFPFMDESAKSFVKTGQKSMYWPQLLPSPWVYPTNCLYDKRKVIWQYLKEPVTQDSLKPVLAMCNSSFAYMAHLWAHSWKPAVKPEPAVMRSHVVYRGKRTKALRHFPRQSKP